MNEVIWECKQCTHENKDLKDETALPMCGNCEEHFEWEDIIHMSDDYAGYLELIDTISITKYAKAAVDLADTDDDVLRILSDCFHSNVKPEEALSKVIKKLNI